MKLKYASYNVYIAYVCDLFFFCCCRCCTEIPNLSCDVCMCKLSENKMKLLIIPPQKMAFLCSSMHISCSCTLLTSCVHVFFLLHWILVCALFLSFEMWNREKKALCVFCSAKELCDHFLLSRWVSFSCCYIAKICLKCGNMRRRITKHFDW